MTSTANPERIETLALSLEETLGASIDRIRDLNDRTHVLAINARIEAARAGVAGRGFRVVAESFGTLNLEIQQISSHITDESARTLEELLSISRELSGAVRGQRLVQLADAVMDVVDRNLYERSCDVRWWATDSAVVQVALDPKSRPHATQRLRTILESYTVYADIVVVDRAGRVVVNGRPDLYSIDGLDVSRQPWFIGAIGLPPGGGFGFQSAHCGDLAAGAPVLVYSCPIRQEGDREILGVLGVVFRWEGLGRVLLDRTARALDGPADLVLVEPSGRILTRQGVAEFGGPCPWPEASELLASPGSGFLIRESAEGRVLVARGLSPGFETYATGWSCLVRQRL